MFKTAVRRDSAYFRFAHTYGLLVCGYPADPGQWRQPFLAARLEAECIASGNHHRRIV